MNEKMPGQAMTVFKDLCKRLDELNWSYEKDEEGMKIDCMAQGRDLPMEIRIRIYAEQQIVALYSRMPYIVPDKRRKDLAIAISQANCSVDDGNFEIDFSNGKILFRLAASYRESSIGKELFKYLIDSITYTVDEYNDKFLAVLEKDMSVEKILKYIKLRNKRI